MTRKTINFDKIDFPPLQLFIELTTACNMRCKHCYLRGGEGPPRALPALDVQGLLGEFNALEGKFVSFSGGEPTLYREWRPVMRYARYLGLDVMLVTNGIGIESKDITFLAEIEATIAVSLDGATVKTHDAIRGLGRFTRTIDCLQRLTKAGLGHRLTLCFTPSQINYKELPGVIKLASQLGIGTVYVSLLELRGRAADAIEELSLNNEAKRHLVFSVFSLQERYPEVALECLNLCYFTERLHGKVVYGDSLDRTLRVTSDGELYLTAYLDDDPFYLGRYVPGTLRKIWYGVKVQKAFAAAAQRVHSVIDCHNCFVRRYCQGGSAAFAWTAHGRFEAVDEFCDAKQRLAQELFWSSE
jgi:radical SAM protein with 4Fe4S-binding SPASM domain